MIDIKKWIELFLQKLNNTFPDRVWFVGLQGSYARGEATDTSDIDVVVIFDELTVSDIECYNSMLNTLPNRELICGFVSGKNELINWEPSDLFQFYYDTKPLKGSLDDLLPLLSDEAIDRAIKIGSCNIYHACLHNMIHDKSDEILKALYKSASFVIQAICFKETRKYMRYLTEIKDNISSEERLIIDTFLSLKNGEKIKFKEMSETLFLWAKKWVKNT